MKKRLFAILMAGVMMATMMVGCGTTNDKPSEPAAADSVAPTPDKPADTEAKSYKIFCSYGHKTAEGPIQWAWGATQAGKELGVQVDYNAAEDGSAEKNVAQIEQAIAQGYDAMVIQVQQADAYVSAINKAMKAGIPVFTYHSDSPDSDRIAWFGSDSFVLSAKAARQIADEQGKQGEVILVQGTTADIENKVMQAFIDELAKYAPEMKIATKLTDTIDPAKAYEKISGAIQANPKAKAFYTSQGQGAAAIAQVVEEMKLEGSSIIGMDPTSASLGLLKEGKITGIVDQGNMVSGYTAVQAAVEYLETGKLSNFKDGVNYIDTEICNKDNMAEYEVKIAQVMDMVKQITG